MPIFGPNPRTKLRFLHPAEKVMPYLSPVLSLIPLTYIKSVLIVADDAIMSTAHTVTRRSKKVDKKFGEAIHLLSGFEKEFPSKDPTSDSNIEGTVTMKTTDKTESPSTILYALKRKLDTNVKFSVVFLSINADES